MLKGLKKSKSLIAGLFFAIMFFVGSFVCINSYEKQKVFAAQYIDAGKVQDMVINISDYTSPLYTIQKNEGLTFENVTIIGDGVTSIEKIFDVLSGGYLFLNNVTITNVCATYVVHSNGVVEANELTVDDNADYSIYSSGTDVVIGKVDISKIYLGSGNLVVNQNTKIADVIDVELSSSMEYTGSLIVRGDNTFAGYFVDKFNYVGNFQYTTGNAISGYTYLDGYLDYVGYTGNVYKKYEEVNPLVVKYKSLNTGDIILTCDTNADKKSGVTSYSASMYGTARRFLENNPGTYVMTNIYYEVADEKIYDGMQTLDNYSFITSGGNAYFLEKINTIEQACSISIKQNGTEKQKCSEILFPGSNKLIFIEKPVVTNNSTIEVSEGLSYEVLGQNDSLMWVLLKTQRDDLSISSEFEINFISNDINNVEVNVGVAEFVYTGADQQASLNPTYELNGETCSIGFEIYKDEVKQNSLTDAGEYIIKLSSDNENIILDKTSYKVVVAQKELDINYLNSDNLVYDGSVKTITTEVIGLIPEVDAGLSFTNLSNTNAGTYTITASITNNNYAIKSGKETYNYTIDKARINTESIVFNNETKEYTRVLYLISATNIPSVLNVEYEYDNRTILNAGTHEIVARFSLKDASNYYPLENATKTAELTITPKEITLVYSNIDNLVYTGVEQEITATANGMILGDDVGLSLSNNKKTNAGTYTATASISNANYVIKAGMETCEFTIDKATIDFDSIIMENETKEYSKSLYIINARRVPTALNVSYEYNADEILNVGSHEIVATFTLNDLDNYYPLEEDSKSAVLTITAKEITIDYLNTENLVYTGQDIAISAIANGVAEGDNVGLTISNNIKKDAGTYTATVTINNDNYVIKEGFDSCEYIIDRARVSIDSVVMQNETREYSKVPYVISATNIPAELNVEYSYDENLINVGRYTITAIFTLKDTKNYYPLAQNIKTAILTIEEKEIDVNYLGTENLVYNEQPKTITAELSGVIEGDVVNVSLSNATNILAGSYTATASIDNANYKIKAGKETCVYTIEKASVTLSGITFANEFREYTKVLYVISAKNIPDYLSVSYEYDSNLILNVGTHDIVARFVLEDSDNYVLTNDTMVATLTITAKEIEIKYNVENLVYTGEEQEVSSEAIGVIEGDDVGLTLSNNKKINAGTYTITASIENSNYVIKSGFESCGYTIEKATINIDDIVMLDEEREYSKELYVISASNIPNVLSVEYSYDENILNVGSYEVIATFSLKDKDNYYPLTKNTKTAILTILEKELDVVYYGTNNLVYDKQEKTITAELIGVITGDVVDLVLTGATNVFAGTYTAFATINNDNYKIKDGLSSCTYNIDKATVNLNNVSFVDEVREYSGNFYKIEVTGLPNEVSVLYSYDENIISAGEHDIVANFDLKDKDNYYPLSILSKTAKLTITQKEIDIVYSGTENLVYNKNPKTITAEVVGVIEGDVVNVTLTNATNTLAGTYTAIASIDNLNYKIKDEKTSCTYVIDKSRVNMEDVVFANETKEYSGSVYVISVRNLPSEVIVTYEYDANIFLLGEHTIVAKFELRDKDNYYPLNVSQATAVLTIVQKEIDVIYGGYENLVYDGMPKTITASVSGVILGENIGFVLSNATNTFAGTYVATASITNANYKIKEGKSSLEYTIEKAVVNMDNIKFDDETVEYSGSLYVINVKNLPGELKVSYEYDSNIFLVGEHNITAKFELRDKENYILNVTCLTAKLTVIRKTISVVGVELKGRTVEYTGQPNSLYVNNLPSKVNVNYSLKDLVDAGEYDIVATLSVDETKYIIEGNKILSAKLIISPANIDMEDVLFEDKTQEYNGSVISIDLSGELPDTIKKVTYINNENSEAGVYNVKVEFEVVSSNYVTPSYMEATLTIEKRELEISLKQSEFVYDGRIKTVEFNVLNIVNGDSVNISATNISNTNAGNYQAIATGVDNPNYKLPVDVGFNYAIAKAVLDMSGISLPSVDREYDGEEYFPKVVGSLPGIVAVKMLHAEIRNVGEYTVVASFDAGSNYVTPASMEAVINITHKNVVIEFSNYQGLVYDGQEKQIGVRLVGLIDGHRENIDITYSSRPLEAGKYTCTVALKPYSNYKISGADTVSFEILATSKTYSDNGYVLTVNTDGISVDSQLLIKQVDLSNNYSEELNNKYKEVCGIDSFAIEVEKETVQSFALKTNKINLNSSNSICLYRISEDGLVEVDYTIENGIIYFSASNLDAFVLVEAIEKSEKNTSLYLILGVVGALALCGGVSTPIILKKRRLRKQK